MIIKEFLKKIKDDTGEEKIIKVRIAALAQDIIESDTRKFITGAQLEKLQGIDEGANKYVHPTGAGNEHIPAGGIEGQFLKKTADGYTWSADNDTKYTGATVDNDGLMTTTHVKALNGKVNKSISKELVLTAGAWTGEDPFTNKLLVQEVTATNNVEILVSNKASDDETKKWMEAALGNGVQEAGSITLKGYGVKPDIDIPVTVIIRDD